MQPRGRSWRYFEIPIGIILTVLCVLLSSSVGFGQTLPPLRGVYPMGMNLINSGVLSYGSVRKTILGGARLSLTATLLINNNSLSSDIAGPISGGGGFGDCYYQTFILGWQKDRTAIRAVYGFLAPTGK